MGVMRLFFLWLMLSTSGNVFTFSVYGSVVRCSIPAVMRGDPTSLTCYFNSDLYERKKSFVVQHVNQHEDLRDILSCTWPSQERPECDSAADYVFSGEISSTVSLTIPSAAVNHVGRYMCFKVGANPKDAEPCNFTLKETASSKLTNRSSTSPVFSPLPGNRPKNVTAYNEQSGTLIDCDAPSVMETNPGHVTCHFPMDLKKENTDFVVQQINRLGQDSEILSCLWLTIDRPLCQPKSGYRIDENEIGSTVNVEIVSATEEHEGTYICLTLPADLAHSSPCNFTLKDLIVTNQTSTLIPNFTSLATTKPWEQKTDEDGATIGIAIAIPIVLVSICLVVIFIFKCRGRLSVWIPKCAKNSEEIYHIEGQPLVPVRKIKSPTTTRPSDQPVEESVFTDCVSAFQVLTTARNTDVTETGRKGFSKYLYNRAVGLVEKTGAVIITGPERSERSTFGFHVMHHFVNQGFFPLVFDHPNQWWEKKQGDRKHVVLLDECAMDKWARSSLTSMLRDDNCYIVFIIRSELMKSDGRGTGLPSYAESIPTADLAKKKPSGPIGPEQVFHACEMDDSEQVVTLLSYGLHTRWVDEEDRTALHVASWRAQPDIVLDLLWAESSVNAQDKDKRTPLHYACSSNSTHKQAKPVQETSKRKQERRGKKSSEHGATNDEKNLLASRESLDTPRGVVVKTLIAFGAILKTTDNTGHTPLHMACKCNSLLLVDILLESGAVVSATDTQGYTPLHEACRNNSPAVAKRLICANSDINVKDKTGRTPLHVACFERAKEAVKILLEAKANIEARSEDGRTPLHMACRGGSKEIVQMLLQNGAKSQATDNKGYTAERFAKEAGHWELALTLSPAEKQTSI